MGIRPRSPGRRRAQVRIEPEAAAELGEALAWYADADVDVASRFALAIDEAIERARLGLFGVVVPLEGVDADVRRVLVKRFPYAVYYLVTARTVRVLAIAHQRRKPGYWLRRI